MAAEIQITDKDGWRKTFVLDKNIVHVGTDPANDVVLESWRGSGVALRHLQLIRFALDSGTAYRLVNLGDVELHLQGETDKTISSHSMEDILGNEELRLGDFSLVFKMQGGSPSAPAVAVPGPAVVATAAPAAAAQNLSQLPVRSAGTEGRGISAANLPSTDAWADRTSTVIGLSLSLQAAGLNPDVPLQGTIAVRNLGQQTGVQFQLELDGLDPDCYILGPGPILFPNAEREMQLILHHPRRPSPPAGERRIAVRVTAPDAYPGECAVVSALIEITPFYDQRLRIVDSESEL